MSGWHARAVGWALRYGVKVYVPGGELKPIETLFREVLAEQMRRGELVWAA